MQDAQPKRLDRTAIYESCWVNLYRDRVALPNGHIVEEQHLLDFGPGAVAMLVENEQGQLLMERVARYATGTTSWELPAGRIEAGESVLDAARREVHEETGYETDHHVQIHQYYPMSGMSNLCVHLVRCRAGARTGPIDENEIRGFRWFSRQELRELIARGEITGGFALVGLLLDGNK